MGAFDLYAEETADRLSQLPAVKSVEAGAFDGFVKGAVYSTMRGFAKTARAVDLLGSLPAILEDKINAFKTGQTATGITEAQDKYFREHDDIFQNAVESWTLKPGEVGIAGEVVGGLLSTLPMVITSPALTVATTQLSEGEDLVRKGVSPEKAGTVGAVQGAGLGLGIWMPILGGNGWQRIVVGGAGFNVLQGVATRGVSGAILEGEKAGEDYKAFDSHALTLDVLLGAAFGTLAHLSPSQRAQGRQAWEKIEGWAKSLQPSQVDAIAGLRQAQHLNVDSAPGIPRDLEAIDSHVEKMRAAVDQLAQDKPVEVSNVGEERLPPGTTREALFKPDEVRMQEAHAQAERLVQVADQVRADEGIRASDVRTQEETGGVKLISTQGLHPSSQFLNIADENLKAGKPSVTPDAPIEVTYNVDTKKYELQDGYHRYLAVRGGSIEAAIRQSDAGQFPEILANVTLVKNVKRHGITEAVEMTGKQRLKYLEKIGVSPRTEGPSAPLAGAEPPPPRSAGGEAPRVPEVDPVRDAASRFATEQPDLRINVGQDAEGKPVTRSVKEFLDDARTETAKASETAKLFEAAATCLFGGGR